MSHLRGGLIVPPFEVSVKPGPAQESFFLHSGRCQNHFSARDWSGIYHFGVHKGGDDMRKRKDEAAWNKEVLRNVKAIQKLRSWLDMVKKYDLSWEDRARVTRALSMLELALTEIYSTMYRNDKEIRLYKDVERSI